MADGIVAEALSYRGTGYVFGGDGWPPGNWDCSSFVTTMLLRRGLPVPGGGRWGAPGYPPGSHGPGSDAYLSFGTGVPIPAAGDLVVWAGQGPNGHIGISLGGDQMISALNPQIGVQITSLATTKGGLMPSAYRRVAGAGEGGPVGAPGGVDVTAAWNAVLPGLPPLRDLLVPAAGVAAVVAAAVVSAGLLYWGGGLLVSFLAVAAATRAAGAVRERVS